VHEFEAIVYERSGELAKRALEVAPKDSTREPLTLTEFGWLWLGYYLTGWNLRRKRLLRVSAGLMPVRPWFRREIYIQLPLKFKGRRFPRRLLALWKKMATGLKSAGSS
jgi:hypothetical protein